MSGCQNHESQEGEVSFRKEKNDQTVDLEIFVHTSETSFFLAMGHVDICYQGTVISYGSYDPRSERLFGMVGDGVLFKANRENTSNSARGKVRRPCLLMV